MDSEEILKTATIAARLEYPITEDLNATERTIRIVLQEGYVKGFMHAIEGMRK